MNNDADIHSENLLTLDQARKYFHSNPLRETVRRYCDEGLVNRYTGQRIFLEAFYEGQWRFTSEEAIERFRRRLNEREPSKEVE